MSKWHWFDATIDQPTSRFGVCPKLKCRTLFALEGREIPWEWEKDYNFRPRNLVRCIYCSKQYRRRK